MKPIFLIGASMLAAGAAYSFTLLAERQELPQSLIQQDRGLAVERVAVPSRQDTGPHIERSAHPRDSVNTDDLTAIPVAPQISTETARSNTPIQETEMPAPAASEQIAAFDHTDPQNQPTLYFVAPNAQNMPPGSPDPFPAAATPPSAAEQRFEKLPFIGVYR